MTIRQLELFTLVYELRNLTRAAERLYMTQSAVTQNLKKMEEELGVRLFERGNRQLSPTRAGEGFYRHAGRIQEEYRKALADLADTEEKLNFYYYAMSSTAIKDRVVAALWEIDPGLTIEQFDRRIGELTDNSRWEPGAVYLVPEEFIRDPEIRTIEVAEVGHYLIMRDNHRLSGQSLVHPENLAGETLLLRSRPEQRFDHLNRALRQLEERGIPYRVAAAESVRELVPKILSFGGVAIVPEYLKSEVPGVVSRPYADGVNIHVKLAYREPLTPRVQKLLKAYRARG